MEAGRLLVVEFKNARIAHSPTRSPKGVPQSLPASACYGFVTDGRVGRLDTFKAFLADMRVADGPDDLDNANKRNFSNSLVTTNREFFYRVNTATRSVTSPLRRSKYGGLEVSEAKRLRSLELENAKRKRLLADVMLDVYEYGLSKGVVRWL